jgi:hypothetical protein
MGPKYSSMLAVSLDREEIEEGKKTTNHNLDKEFSINTWRKQRR